MSQFIEVRPMVDFSAKFVVRNNPSDLFHVHQLEGRENNAGKGVFSLDLITTDADFEFENILGKTCTLSLSYSGLDTKRHGVVRELTFVEDALPSDDGDGLTRFHYRVELVTNPVTETQTGAASNGSDTAPDQSPGKTGPQPMPPRPATGASVPTVAYTSKAERLPGTGMPNPAIAIHHLSGVIRSDADNAMSATGQPVSKRERGSRSSDKMVFSGTGNCLFFHPGGLFRLKGHPRNAFNQMLVLTSVVHEGVQPQFSPLSDDDKAAAATYSNTFEAIAASGGEVSGPSVTNAAHAQTENTSPETGTAFRPIRSATGILFELGDKSALQDQHLGAAPDRQDSAEASVFPPPIWEAIAEIDPGLLPRHLSEDVFYEEQETQAVATGGGPSAISVLPSAIVHVPEVTADNYTGPDVETYLRLGGGTAYNAGTAEGRLDEDTFVSQAASELINMMQPAMHAACSAHGDTVNCGNSTDFDTALNEMFATLFSTVREGIPDQLSTLSEDKIEAAVAAFDETDHEPEMTTPLPTETGWLNVSYGSHLTMALNAEGLDEEEEKMTPGEMTMLASSAQNLVAGKDQTLFSAGDQKFIALGNQRHFAVGDNTGIVFGGDDLYVVGDTSEHHLKNTEETFYGTLTETKFSDFTEVNEAKVNSTTKGKTTEKYEGEVEAEFDENVTETYKGKREETFHSVTVTRHMSLDFDFWLGLSLEIGLNVRISIGALMDVTVSGLVYDANFLTVEQKLVKIESVNGADTKVKAFTCETGGMFVTA